MYVDIIDLDYYINSTVFNAWPWTLKYCNDIPETVIPNPVGTYYNCFGILIL